MDETNEHMKHEIEKDLDEKIKEGYVISDIEIIPKPNGITYSIELKKYEN